MEHGSEWLGCQLLVPRQDLRWLRVDASVQERLLEYELLYESPELPAPERAVCLPFKTPIVAGIEEPWTRLVGTLGIVETMRSWLGHGTHLAFVLPCPARVDGTRPDTMLLNRCEGLVGELVGPIGDVIGSLSVGQLSARAIDGTCTMPLGEGRWSCYFHERGDDGSWPRDMVLLDQNRPAVDALPSMEVLARNAHGKAVAVTMEHLGGRVTLVPRTLLAGSLAPLQRAYPRSLHLEMPRNDRAKGKRETGTVLVNCEPIELPYLQYLYLETLWRGSWRQRTESRQVDWPDELHEKARERVGKALRERLWERGYALVLPGSGGTSPCMHASVAPPEFELQGWEKPEESEA